MEIEQIEEQLALDQEKLRLTREQLQQCFDRDTSMCHNRDFVHGLVVFAESACPCFVTGKHPTRKQWERLNPEIAAEAARRVKTIVEKAESLTVTTL